MYGNGKTFLKIANQHMKKNPLMIKMKVKVLIKLIYSVILIVQKAPHYYQWQ